MNAVAKPSVITFQPAAGQRMTPQDYGRERDRLREVYGDSADEAGSRFEQALARLFYRSGWSQEELAKVEGKSTSSVDRLLRFGRFLDFPPSGGFSENPLLSKLSERRFRDYWSRTSSAETNERIRFREVHRLIDASSIAAPKRTPIINDIVKAFADDGRWHRAATIGKRVDADADYVVERLTDAKKQGKLSLEKRRNGKHDEFRIFRMDRTISLAEIANKLTPIIEDIRQQSKCAPGTVSNAAIARLAAQMSNLLDEWRG